MGLKSGSRDAELDDGEAEGETSDADEGPATENETGANEKSAAGNETDETDEGPADGKPRTNDEHASDSVESAPDEADGSTDGPPTETADDADGKERDSDRAGDPTATDGDEETTAAGPGQAAADRPSVESLPYVLRRDRVNEGRDQVPFFLREAVIDGERDLRESLEATLGENVYKSDYREAAMVVAQEHPELVAAVLRRWGYDL